MGVIGIDPTVLLSWAQGRSGQGGSTAGSTSGSSTPAHPTPPWSVSATTTTSSSSASQAASQQLSQLARSVLNGARFFDTAKAKLDVTGADAKTNTDYKNLFALYQGLNAMNALAQRAGSTGVSATELSQLQTRFAQGMKDLQSFLQQAQFNSLQVAQGKIAPKQQTTAGAPIETDVYTGQTIYQGTVNGVVPAFQGPVQFSLTAARTSHPPVTVDFDLSEMGATPRTMGSVIQYMNGKMQAAGLTTTFTDVFTPAPANTIIAGGKTVTLPPGPDQFALKIKGVSQEALTFSAPTSSPAVYVAQTSGNAAAAKPDAVQQLLKFQTDAVNGDPSAFADRISQTNLPSVVQAARATATGPDGSLYVLADVNGTTPDGQTIKGQQDVALMKYDSAGALVYTRTLGAADSASGFGLTVSADGSQVAVAGSASGVLEGTTTATDPSVPNTFVTVFSAAGDEQWTQRSGSKQGDQPASVAFAADGSVYVAGQTASALPGATSQGRSDGYLQGFSATGVAKFAVQFGTSGQDSASSVAVSGSSVYVAGVEGGHAVVRQYDLQPVGAPVLTATRDLGDLQGGNITGIGVNTDGSIVVAGSTTNAALDPGAQTGQPLASGKAAFVATFQPGLAADPADAISYFAGGGDTTATKMVLSGGQAYLTGQVTGAPIPASGGLNSQTGFAAAIDPVTGAAGWTAAMTGLDNLSSPNAIAVDPTGASILDQLGLPKGEIAYAKSDLLVANTSLRAGDEFFVSSGSGPGTAVTVTATDTLKTLAHKIAQASGFQLTATVLPVDGENQIKITPLNSRSRMQLIAGPNGRDALAGLGLVEGILNAPLATKTTSATGLSTKPSYSLQLSSTMNLGNAADIKTAQTALQTALGSLKTAYMIMTTPPPAKATTGTVPAYLTKQLAAYTDALNRITASQSSSSTTLTTASLIGG